MARTAVSTSALQERAILTFEEFFRSTYTRLARTLYLLTGDPADAEELAQEAMARVFERWETVRSMHSPGGYVYRTAINLQRKKLRRDALRRRVESPIEEDADPISTATTRQDLDQALASLPPAQRETVVLVDWLGYDAVEAGAILGIRSEAVRGRVHRARTNLRNRLGGVGE